VTRGSFSILKTGRLLVLVRSFCSSPRRPSPSSGTCRSQSGRPPRPARFWTKRTGPRRSTSRPGREEHDREKMMRRPRRRRCPWPSSIGELLDEELLHVRTSGPRSWPSDRWWPCVPAGGPVRGDACWRSISLLTNCLRSGNGAWKVLRRCHFRCRAVGCRKDTLDRAVEDQEPSRRS